jgi:hypothetical protein
MNCEHYVEDAHAGRGPDSHQLVSAAVIDFESFDLAGQSSLDVSSPLLFSNVNGEGVSVTIVAGARFRITDLSRFITIRWPRA